MKKLLFVCTGNTCRSPMAEGLCRLLLQQRGITDVQVSSAGLMAVPGEPASRHAIAAMQELGVDISHHAARQLTADLMDADRIVTMTAAQSELLRSVTDRAVPMPQEIPDPYGGDLDAYRACRDAIRAALPTVLEALLYEA